MITEDMKRLSSEIVAAREPRANLIAQLVQGTQERRKSVSRLLANMRKAMRTAAVAAHRERVKGVRDLRREVAVVRRVVRTDMAGARKAWAGVAA